MEDINSPENSGWEPLIPLNVINIPPWPDQIFPQPFKGFVEELFRSTETPPELASAMVLATVSAIAQRKYIVQVKEDYREPVNLWTLSVLATSSRKTKVYDFSISPLRTWERKQHKLLESQVQNASSRRQVMEERLKILRGQAARADDASYKELQAQIEKYEKELPQIPVYPRLWTSDVTPEALRELMITNNETMAIFNDEGALFDILNGMYSDGKANIDLLLQAHSGSPVRIDRKTSPPVIMERPLLSIGLTVQPIVVQGLCKNRIFRGRGLLGRILYFMPKSNIGYRTWDQSSIDPICMAEYESALALLLEDCFDKQTGHHVLFLEPTAYAKWLEYARLVEKLMGPEIGYLAHIADWAGKLPGAIIRIAGILHIMKHIKFTPSTAQIALETVESAISLGHVLTSHALAAFDLMEEGTAKQDVQEAHEWLREVKMPTISRRDFSRRFRRLRKEGISSILEIMQEHNIIRRVEKLHTGIGRHKDLFEINPLVFKKG